MKAKGMILLAIMALIGVLGVNAQDIIPVDSLYNAKIGYTITYTKELLQKMHNKICLPKEVNTLMKIEESKKLYAKPLWDSAYIKNETDDMLSYIVPIKCGYDNKEVMSELIVTRSKSSYHRLVTSCFTVTNDSVARYVTLNSNIFGELVGYQVYDEDMNTIKTIPISNKDISCLISSTINQKNNSNIAQNKSFSIPSIQSILNEESYRYNRTDVKDLINMEPIDR